MRQMATYVIWSWQPSYTNYVLRNLQEVSAKLEVNTLTPAYLKSNHVTKKSLEQHSSNMLTFMSVKTLEPTHRKMVDR